MSTLDNPQETTGQGGSASPIIWRYGLLTGLVLILLGLVFYLTGLQSFDQPQSSSSWIITIVNLVVLFGGLYLAIQQHRDQNLGGYITFGKGFTVGLLTSLVVAVVSAIWTIVFFTLVEPNATEMILEASKDQMANEQGMSDEQIEQAMTWASWMTSPSMMTVFALLGTVFQGLILSLIAGGVLAKRPPESAGL